MTDEAPSLWTMDRATIAGYVADGRSPRGGEFNEREKRAVEELLQRPDFDSLTTEQRANLYQEYWRAAGPPLSPATAEIHAPAGDRDGNAMLKVGWTLVIVGLALSFYAYAAFPVSIHSDADFVAGTMIEARDTINIGLLQNQLMLFLMGLIGFLAGMLALLAHRIVLAVQHNKRDAG